MEQKIKENNTITDLLKKVEYKYVCVGFPPLDIIDKNLLTFREKCHKHFQKILIDKIILTDNYVFIKEIDVILSKIQAKYTSDLISTHIYDNNIQNIIKKS